MAMTPPVVPAIVIQDLIGQARMGSLCDPAHPCIGFKDAEGRMW